jgi:hypothetical protein
MVGLLVAGAAAGGNFISAAPAAHAVVPHPAGADFNGDGYPDVAISVAGETVNGASNAGGIHVLFGAKDGLHTAKSQFVTNATDGIAGDPVAGEGFGARLAHGDLNADGYDDLVVGVPRHAIENYDDAGGVHVLFGSAKGLLTDHYFDQSTPGIPGTLGYHHFGDAVAVGDFDGDGIDDLAVGAPYDTGWAR